MLIGYSWTLNLCRQRQATRSALLKINCNTSRIYFTKRIVVMQKAPTITHSTTESNTVKAKKLANKVWTLKQTSILNRSAFPRGFTILLSKLHLLIMNRQCVALKTAWVMPTISIQTFQQKQMKESSWKVLCWEECTDRDTQYLLLGHRQAMD